MTFKTTTYVTWQNAKGLYEQTMTSKDVEAAAYNSTLAIGGVSSPLDSFVVKESSVLRTNFSAEKPAHRQSANRYASPEPQISKYVSLIAALSPFFL